MPHVEVVYATRARQLVYTLTVEPGATAREAIERSGVLAAFPEIDLARHRIGIHGRRAALSTVLEEHDRVEILRPLVADPKEVRRRRAAG